MPRTLPAALTTAMDSGIFEPYLKVRIMLDDPDVYTTVDVLDFKITDVTAECTIPYDVSYLSKTNFAIERGCWIAGVPVTIRTVYYQTYSMQVGPLGINLKGHILPPIYASFDGCIWYMDVIDRIVGAFNGYAWDTTTTYEDDTAPWLSYLFYPSGRNLTLANIQSFFSVIAQKYLVYFAENINGLFAFQSTTVRAKDYDITDELLSYEVQKVSRRLMWRDEAMTLHYSGMVQSPLHNLGYIDSIQGAAPTNTASPKPFKSSKLPVHLKYRTGDVAKLGTASNYFQGRIKVTEVFDPKSNPSWHVIIEPLCWFNNTEGGAMPSTIEAAAPYTPLHTGYFNHVLSPADNNIQAAMETIDDHKHDADYAPIAKGVTNGDSHDHAGGDGGQVDHGGLAGLGDNDHPQYTNLACVAYHSATRTIGNDSWTTLPLDSELTDPATWHDLSTNNERIYAPTTGLYLMCAMALSWAGNAAGARGVMIIQNAAITVAKLVVPTVAATLNSVLALTGIRAMTAGDYVWMQAYQSSGGNLDLAASYKLALVRLY